MKFSKTILGIVIGFFVIIYIVITMYLHQIKINRYHAELSTTVDKLANDNLAVNYDVLSVSLFAYSNDDKIAKDTKRLLQNYHKLYAHPILKYDNYAKLMPLINHLDQVINKKLTNVTWFLILNANIKNSFVFLLNYARQSRFYFQPSNPIHQKINHIINKMSYIKRIQDSNYQYSFKLLLPLKELNKKQLNYIHIFNMHDTYIQTHMHNFLYVTNQILTDPTQQILQMLNKKFGELTKHDNQQLNIQTIFILIISSFGAFMMIFLAYKQEQDNKKLEKVKVNLLYQASHDSLTGLLNRFSLENTLKYNTDHLLFLIDINGFKHINDFYGTDIGNTLLQEFAKLIQVQDLKEYHAMYYRASGDTFVILTHKTPLKTAVHIAKRVRDLIISHNFSIKGIDISLDAKIAINEIDPLLENADIGLKDIKSKNEKSIMVFSNKLKLKEKIKENLDILELVKHAVSDNRVVAFFQPILNLKSKEIEKYEALVRIIKEDGSILPPIAFLSIIEMTSLYYNITEIMIQKIIEVAQKNRQHRFSLNLSMQDLQNKKLMNMLFNKLKANQVNGANIDIELLETQNLCDIKTVQAFIDKAHQVGCKILIDDFGTGYSNFAYLSKLDIDILKIDASIVKNILSNSKMLQTIKTIVQFAQALNLQTVAEFVDNQDVLEKLKEVGIDYAQGYLIGKPDILLKTN